MAHKNGPWTVQSSREVFHNAFIRVRHDDVLQPDGQPGQYATVALPVGVAVLPLDNERIHLVRQFRYALGRESLEAVSGGLQAGEDKLAAARRELREELGIEADDWTDLGQVDPDTSIVRGTVHLFLARHLTFAQPEREGTEAMRPVALSLAEAALQVMQSEITHGPSCVLILKAARWLAR